LEDPERYKIFYFCEQTLKIGANDAPGQGLQTAQKTGIKLIFLRKLWVFQC
jgi:hypothetical protein